MRDIERLAGRAAAGRATPREMGALRDSFERLPDVAAALSTLAAATLPAGRKSLLLEHATDELDLLADLASELAELTREANRANATLYTIDPRGLVGGPDLDENVDQVEWQNHIRETQQSLRVLAEQTGGQLPPNFVVTLPKITAPLLAINAADDERNPPIKLYLLFDDQPASAIP